MVRSRIRPAAACGGCLVVALAGLARADAYDPPAGYYSTATGTGATLKQQLHNVIDGHQVITYDDLRVALQKTDASLADASRMVLFYEGTLLNVGAINPSGSIPGWDSGASWTREHTWPASRQAPTSGQTSGPDYSDAHIVRPAGDGNGDRGSLNFGGSGSAPGVSGSYYFPGVLHKGDAARGAFYAAVRYDGSDANTMDLEVVDGDPDIHLGRMGNKQDLLRYHYEDVPDEWERRRNQRIYNGNLSGTGWGGSPVNQGNRNPFIDRPEFVWSVFGDGANDSRLTVTGGTPAGGDASATTSNVTLGPVIVGAAALGTQTVTIGKSGADPTYFAVSATGDATSSVSGRFNAFTYSAATRQTTIGLNASTATAGLKTGQVTVDNLDVTNGGAGTGALDGVDTINVSAAVLDHAQASFAAGVNDDDLVLDFGEVDAGGSASLPFALHNLPTTAGFTAGLDLDAVVLASGDGSAFSLDATQFKDLAAGSFAMFEAEFLANQLGEFTATYTLRVSDADLPGALAGVPLALTLHGVVVPEPAVATVLAAALALASLPRRRR